MSAVPDVVQGAATMSALDMLHTRGSASRLQDPPPDDAALDAMFKAAVRAPDHGRLRPWRFIVIGGEARQQFGQVMADSLRRRREDATPEMLDRERAKALRAPLIVVVAAHVQQGKIPEIEQVLSAGAAAQNIMLAAHALGYGAMWKTGDPAYDPSVKQALGLDEADAIVGFLYLGSVAVPSVAAQRPTADDYVTAWHGA